MKTDRLVLVRGCQTCSAVRSVIDFAKIQDDDFVGSNGHRLFVFLSSSNDSGVELLDGFGLSDYMAPVLSIDGGGIIDSVAGIIDYLRRNNFTER